jgi:RNA recognition motif-containing protein
MNIYVGNLYYGTNEDSLRNLFSGYGDVISVKVVKDMQSGRSRGFGFVEMSDEHGKEAISALHEKELEGRKILVNEAHQKTSREGGSDNQMRRPKRF